MAKKAAKKKISVAEYKAAGFKSVGAAMAAGFEVDLSRVKSGLKRTNVESMKPRILFELKSVEHDKTIGNLLFKSIHGEELVICFDGSEQLADMIEYAQDCLDKWE